MTDEIAYKTPKHLRDRAAAYEKHLRTELGEEAYLARKREQRASFKARYIAEHGEAGWAEYRRKKRFKHPGGRHYVKAQMVANARKRASAQGKAFDLTVATIYWPERCPVFGYILDYSTPMGDRFWRGKDHGPSLDRYDNAKGYTVDNVRVISLRANRLKSNATPDELRRVADYAEFGVF